MQIDEYEELYKELSQIEQQKIFDRWLLVDNQPFKQALLNTVCKWGNMFKQHLVDHVINRYHLMTLDLLLGGDVTKGTKRGVRGSFLGKFFKLGA